MRVGRPERQVKPLGHCFRAAHPLIGLAVEILPFVDMFPTLAVRLQARTSDPDIVFYDCICDSPLTASHAVRGHLVDRTPHLEAACITKAALDAASWQGKLGSVPFGGSRQVLFDDEARCREAALAPTEPDPAEPWTREQVVEAAERLADPAEGRGGSASSSRSAPVRSSPSAGPGRDRFEPGRVRGERLPRRAALPRAYRVVRTVYIEWKVRPPGPFDPNLPVEPFGNSRIAMLLAGTFDAFVLADKHGDLEVGVAPFPDFAKGEPVTPDRCLAHRRRLAHTAQGGGTRLHPPFHDLEAANPVLRAVPYPPVRKSVREKEGKSFDPDMRRIARYALGHTAVPRPATPGFRENEDLLRVALRGATTGADVEATVKAAAPKIDRELQKYR